MSAFLSYNLPRAFRLLNALLAIAAADGRATEQEGVGTSGIIFPAAQA